jgi:DoxX-like family
LPSSSSSAVGAGELLSAALLVVPRAVCGATILVVIMTGAVITHIANQDPLSQSISAPVHLALVAVVAWVPARRRPPFVAVRQ